MSKKAETKESERNKKKAYLERKKRLAAFEENNYRKIVFLRGTKGFYTVGGHSVVILVNKIAPEIKIRVAPKRDTDFGVKFKEGVINLKNLDFYKEKMASSIYLEKEIQEEEDFVAFTLKEPISETEYKILVKSKEIRRQKLQAMIEKSLPMPKLNMRMTEVLKLTYRYFVKHSDSFGRAFVVQKLADDIRTAHKTMLLTFREQIEPKKGLERMKFQLEMAMCDLGQIVALDLWNLDDSTTLSTMIVETQVIIDSEIGRIEKMKMIEAKDVKTVKELIKNNT